MRYKKCRLKFFNTVRTVYNVHMMLRFHNFLMAHTYTFLVFSYSPIFILYSRAAMVWVGKWVCLLT
jgi:hypothetical protein